MAHKLVVLEWLYKADEDFGFAKTSLGQTDYFDQICFHFQQATEKYLKAYIVKFDLKFEKIHDLVKLLAICATHNLTLKVLKEDCRFLTPFYFEIRYADQIFITCTKKQAREAYQRAKRVRDLIKEKIGIRKEITLEDLKKEHRSVDKILKKDII